VHCTVVVREDGGVGEGGQWFGEDRLAFSAGIKMVFRTVNR
jgi:hypothetical protein